MTIKQIQIAHLILAPVFLATALVALYLDNPILEAMNVIGLAVNLWRFQVNRRRFNWPPYATH